MEGARKPFASLVAMVHHYKGRELPPYHQNCTNISEGGPSSHLAFHSLLSSFSLYFPHRAETAAPSPVAELFQQPVKMTL